MITGGLIMTAFAAVMNYLVLIPLYASALGFPLEAIIEMSNSANSMIVDLKTLILVGITPFNLFKALVNILITTLIYKKLSPILHTGPISRKQEQIK
jgi:riboflavin transporter FmnP